MNVSPVCLLLLAGCSVVLAPRVLALTTLDFDAGPGLPRVLGLNLSPLVDASQVRIGAFADGFDPASAAGDPALLAAQWNAFGALETQTIFGEVGRFGGSVSGSTSGIEGDRVWLWILETDDGSDPLPDWSNLRAHGVFGSLASHWVFPAVVDLGPFSALATSSITQFAWGSSQSGNLALAAPVPEGASSSVFAGAAALALALAGARRQRLSVGRSNP